MQNISIHQVPPLAGDSSIDHMTPSDMMLSQAMKTFTSITYDRTELEKWAMCRWVYAVMTQRLIYNLTYVVHLSGQVMWPDTGQIFKLTYIGFIMHMYQCVSTNTDYFSLPSLVEIIENMKSWYKLIKQKIWSVDITEKMV